MSEMFDDNGNPIERAEPRKPKRGAQQRGVKRGEGGEMVLSRNSQTIQCEIEGNPDIEAKAKEFEKLLANRRPDYKPAN